MGRGSQFSVCPGMQGLGWGWTPAVTTYNSMSGNRSQRAVDLRTWEEKYRYFSQPHGGIVGTCRSQSLDPMKKHSRFEQAQLARTQSDVIFFVSPTGAGKCLLPESHPGVSAGFSAGLRDVHSWEATMSRCISLAQESEAMRWYTNTPTWRKHRFTTTTLGGDATWSPLAQRRQSHPRGDFLQHFMSTSRGQPASPGCSSRRGRRPTSAPPARKRR
mmetsp:Transcript_53347/g.117126  ORF Transcript_53347/g.117126 Transcript_53347/m.117126 type:complete len:216 (+) Transcript_53347:942-1589(+)